MIKAHRRFLYTRPIRMISVGLVILFLALLLSIGDYQEQHSYLEYHQHIVQYDYLLQGFLPLQLLLVLYISFLWIYATRWNGYDMFFMVKHPPKWVIVSRYLVLIEASMIFGVILGLLYTAVYLLYPYSISIVSIVTLYRSIILFVLYYNSFCFVLERLILHLFGLFIPVIAFLISLLQQEVIWDENRLITGADYLQILTPNIQYIKGEYTFMFGEILVISVLFIWLIITMLFVQKQDYL